MSEEVEDTKEGVGEGEEVPQVMHTLEDNINAELALTSQKLGPQFLAGLAEANGPLQAKLNSVQDAVGGMLEEYQNQLKNLLSEVQTLNDTCRQTQKGLEEGGEVEKLEYSINEISVELQDKVHRFAGEAGGFYGKLSTLYTTLHQDLHATPAPPSPEKTKLDVCSELQKRVKEKESKKKGTENGEVKKASLKKTTPGKEKETPEERDKKLTKQPSKKPGGKTADKEDAGKKKVPKLYTPEAPKPKKNPIKDAKEVVKEKKSLTDKPKKSGLTKK